MGISLDRALELQRRGVERIIDAYSSAQSFCSPSNSLHAKCSEILSDMRAKHAPRWAIAHVEGYSRALMANLYRYSLVYGGYLDGQFMSTHSSRADYYEKQGIEPREFAEDGRVRNTGHYWAADVSRPFFIGANQ